ncbi:mycofactocin biosynthesis glycosyltransferase MftF [Nocardia sp. BSTN01]|uniref:mycofactocin biosynthesis glycosyltransferase MftF n=1 Tax=Nocardia sp. BSTN01 TaxID=2783665 RepID=UPI00188EC0DB|nr:mycofactocin biosynthesis glycosyltransferase MftF [Nocardia sp. BSTN01]MBF5001755.1 mycofactocin biosynthesis glycosyltransferase MftF [Nocardia sp. BSTN01]
MTVTLRPDARLRSSPDGRVLLGGSPLRMLRLSPTGARRVRAWFAGEPVGSDPGAQALAQRMLAAGVAHPAIDRGRHTIADVTVVVPVKDNPTGLIRLLAATGDVGSRIVVDDGSAVPVTGHIAEDGATPPTVTILRHASARGPAAARNSGYRSVRTELIAFLDSDIVPDPGWLDPLLPLFDDPAVAAVAPRVRTFERGVLGAYEAHRSSLDMGGEPAVVRPGGRISYVPTAALVVRRSAVDRAGGFDESLRYGEDVDLIWRLVGDGKLVRYQPDSVVRHEPRTTLRAWLRQRYDYGTSAAVLARRHPGHLHCARLPHTTALRWATVALGRPWLGIATAAEPVRQLRRLRAAGLPASMAATVVGEAELAAVGQLADALRRIWWPAALFGRRGRTLLLAAYLPVVVRAVRAGRDPRAGLLRIADDLAYGLGVWAGCLRARTTEPVVPLLYRTDGDSDAPR